MMRNHTSQINQSYLWLRLVFFTMPRASDLVPIREYSPFLLLIYRFGITYIVTS